MSDASTKPLIPPMRELLERAGFRIRSGSRADCARCTGRSGRTVSYTPEVAYCHRCQWTANLLTLAKELGLLSADPATRARLRREVAKRAERDAELAAFGAWVERRYNDTLTELHRLMRRAKWAEDILQNNYDKETAWTALATFYHRRPVLDATLDYLMCLKASPWLDVDSTPVELFRLWRSRTAGKRPRFAA